MFLSDVSVHEVLDGKPQKKISQLTDRGIENAAQLLRYFPKKYEDRSILARDFSKLDIYIGQKISVVGTFAGARVGRTGKILIGTVTDGFGGKVYLHWFGQMYLSKKLIVGQKYLFYGKLEYREHYGFVINSPAYTSWEIGESTAPMPVYKSIPGMSMDYLASCISDAYLYACNHDEIEDPVPEYLCKELDIDTMWDFFRKVHSPRRMQDTQDAKKRIDAETLLPFVWELMERKYIVRTTTDKSVPRKAAEQALNRFTACLPFQLTDDQAKTLDNMIQTVSSGRILDALVQGDVGCGKTAIAEAMAVIMAEAGYQTAIMAPTSVLAEQHFKEFSTRLGMLGIKVVQWCGAKMKAKERREMLESIASGEAKVIVGTHAIISDEVVYPALGLTIVDEEHRFGVEQRKKLRQKMVEGAHSISMSATPIPRSLALALYGDTTTVYNIMTMPANRKPVITSMTANENKAYESIYHQIQQGRQAYVVCPLISASDTLENVESLEETYEKAQRFYAAYPEVRLACINGKMKSEEVRQIITDYADGKYDILFSTTIVEVGVNNPNATVMLIKNAERFGLAQLHQMRGRVGRGKYQSYCVLLSTERENPRLQAMLKSNNGFEIAQMDLQYRGMGNLVGTEQSGFDKAVTAMVGNPIMYKRISDVLNDVFEGRRRYESMRDSMQTLGG